MAIVDPIKEMRLVKRFGELLEKNHSKQMYYIWRVGLNLGLKITELLSIRYEDISEDIIILRRGERGSKVRITMGKLTMSLISEMRKENPYHIYLFQSYRNQQSLNRPPSPLGRKSVVKPFNEVAEILGLNIGTMSIRKTAGFFMFNSTGSIEQTMKFLGYTHAERVTEVRKFIGVEPHYVPSKLIQLCNYIEFSSKEIIKQRKSGRVNPLQEFTRVTYEPLVTMPLNGFVDLWYLGEGFIGNPATGEAVAVLRRGNRGLYLIDEYLGVKKSVLQIPDDVMRKAIDITTLNTNRLSSDIIDRTHSVHGLPKRWWVKKYKTAMAA